MINLMCARARGSCKFGGGGSRSSESMTLTLKREQFLDDSGKVKDFSAVL